jgi:S-DNA-T family DNA segregation ATPase FtsK/SpoIIIE
MRTGETMAGRDNRRKGEPDEAPRWSNEVSGLLWIAGGLVLLLSLIRYGPADLPRWSWFDAFAAKNGERGENLLGPVGGMIGFLQILLFGAAAYLLPLGLLWLGLLKLVFKRHLWPRVAIGLVLMLVAGAVWLHACGWCFKDWAARCQIPGKPGGVIGASLGGLVLVNSIGTIGTLLLSGVVYLVSVVLAADRKPLAFFGACLRLVWEKFLAWREGRSEAGKVAAREAELLAEKERQREQRRKEREEALAAARRSAADEDEAGQAYLPLREIQPPQIIDASRPAVTGPVKPGSKPFERKRQGHRFLSVDGFANYELPGFDLLDADESGGAPEADRDELLATQHVIIETLKAFGIDVTPGDITRGPTITRYEIYPGIGLRVSRISQLEADIARATRAERINILAPIPGKDTVGIEIANSQKIAVPLRELLHDAEFRSAKKKIPLALGKDVYGRTVIGDLAAMPHLLVAGATGSGKSVCINSIIASMLFKFGPDELRFIMVDPKVVEMQMYNRLPHLVVPVVTDPKKTVAALKWVVNEMEKRYRIFAKEGVRNFDSFNNRPRPERAGPAMEETVEEEEGDEEEQEEESGEWEEGGEEEAGDDGEDGAEESGDEVPRSHRPPDWVGEEEEADGDMDEVAAALAAGDLAPEEDEDVAEEEEVPDRFPYIVVLIDELADLMQTAPADVEMCIARIAQKARAAGIHLIIATQTPRADVVTGIIKANIPCRIAFQVSSQLDSRVILDTKGAEKLVGKGDMLYLPPGSAKLERAQGAFVTDAEVERIIDHCAAQGAPRFEADIQASLSGDDSDEEEVSDADEELVIKCIEVVRQEGRASTSLLQRRLRLGYTRAARLIDILEQRGVIGPGDGAKPREVFLK